MICQACNENNATVHITEMPLDLDEGLSPEAASEGTVLDKHICPACAQQLNLPHMQVVSKNTMDIWKLLQMSTSSSSQDPKLTCPDCGMTLAEFRSKGRLGCANDYELFRAHLDALLVRMHNAREHTGYAPDVDNGEVERREQISTLLERLQVAIRDEAYEAAAELRDELKTLQEG